MPGITSSSVCYGALPLGFTSTEPSGEYSITRFLFNYTTDILHSTVSTCDTSVVYHAGDELEGYTTLKESASGRSIALIEWAAEGPMVEIRNTVQKQDISDWLRLSSNGRSRYMLFRGVEYVWSPQGNSICLMSDRSPAAQLLARITRTRNQVYLDVTGQVSRLSLLVPCIVATILMQSGRNID